jgi:hypothetical protein
MDFLSIIVGIIIIYLFVDIYYRITSVRRYTRFLLLSNEITNKILTIKKVIDKEEINDARKETLDKMYIGDYKSLKKDLKKIGIDIEK